MNPQARPARFGKYLLVEKLGQGGMAEVWKARIVGPAGFQRTLVVKRILPHLVEDEHFVKMFVAEARLSARLNHANIVQVFELGNVEGEYFLAMEYVRGCDLVRMLKAQAGRGALDPGVGAYVAREVCRALGYAHALTDERGQLLRIIHRDVSPSNIMVGFDGAVKLLDFGIAKALAEAGESKTQTGTLKGKFGYMAPEQVEGRDIDHRADLFAAGIVLWEALTARRLFKGTSDMQTIALVREARVEPPSKLNPNVPPELDRICLRALARDPNDRYPNCEEMALELDRLVYQLNFSPEKLRGVLRDLFPDEPSQTDSQVLVPEPASQLTVGKLRGRERRRTVAYLAAGIATVGGLAWLIAATRQPATPVAPPPPAPLVQPAPPPAAPATVGVRLHTTPPGAEVRFDGDASSQGVTPITLVVPRGDEPRRLLVRLGGYRPETVVVVPVKDTSLDLTLLAEAKPERERRSGKTRRPPPKADRPTSPPRPPPPNLRQGDVVDPFSR